MKVSELIAKLSEYPQDADVVLYDFEDGWMCDMITVDHNVDKTRVYIEVE